MNWKYLSWKQYHDLITKMDDGGDNLDYVSIVYSIHLTELKQRPVKEVMELIKSIGFISDLPDKKAHKVESILGINLPNDIGNWPFGLIEDIKALTMQVVSASNQIEVMRANYPLIVACAYQYMKVGQYNSTEAKKCVSDIESLPWMDIYSIVDFFFLKSIGLEHGMKAVALTTATNQKKYKQVSKTLRHKWAYWLRSKLLQVGILLKKMKF